MASTKYITTAEAKALLGLSGEDDLIGTLIEWASKLFDTLIWSSYSLDSSEKSEFHALYRPDVSDCEQGTVFYLRTINPTAVSTINGVSVGAIDVGYILEGQKLTLKDLVTMPTGFPNKHKITYTSGFTTMPEDIKLAVKYLVAGLYNSRKSQGISSFRQDLLSVNYSGEGMIDTILDTEQGNFVRAVVNKYKIFFVC